MAVRQGQAPSLKALLRQFRLDRGLTQEELAERALISTRSVSDLERGLVRRPHRDTVARLADALSLSAEEHTWFQAEARSLRVVPPMTAQPGGPSPPTNLPFEVTSFVGRECELRRVIALLQEPSVRLLTLLGTGGSGKTRLALRVGRTMLPGIDDGVFLVSLGPIRSPSHVLPTLASTLGIRGTPAQPWLDVLATALEDRHVILILDNMEHVLPAAPDVQRLLERIERLQVLATSRAALHIYGEHEFSVSPLSVPDLDHLPSSSELMAVPSVDLFCDRARAIQPDFSLTPETASAVAEICVRLDGLPLAIELAAPRLQQLSPMALARRLSSRLGELAHGTSDRPERQWTLRATIDWSYGLLSQSEQALFAGLSVFVGGCTLKAAERVCNPQAQLDLLRGMATLVDQSLIERQGRDEPRFLMLETVREYAAERLEEGGDVLTYRAAHAAYFLSVAEEAEPELWTLNQRNRLSQVLQELDNLRTALRTLLDTGRFEEELRLASALYRLWYVQGYWSEGRRWLEEGLAGGDDIAWDVRSRGLLALGELSMYQGDTKEAASYLADGLRQFQAHGHDQGCARALILLGQAESIRSPESATTLSEESLEIYSKLGDRRGCAAALHTLGRLDVERGDWTAARKRFQDAAALFQDVGDEAYIAESLLNLGGIAWVEGELAEAEGLFIETLERARDVGVKHTMGYALLNLAKIAANRGQFELAQTHLQESSLLARDAQDGPLSLAILDQLASEEAPN